jgi:hypothetical protein
MNPGLLAACKAGMPLLRTATCLVVSIVVPLSLAACSGRPAPPQVSQDEHVTAPDALDGTPTPPTTGSVSDDGDAVERIDGLHNVETVVYALGSVWAVTSSRPDVYSQQALETSVVRVDPETRQIESVLDRLDNAPTFSEIGNRLWVNLSDRMVALDASGTEVASVPFTDGPTGHVAGTDHLWVIDAGAATISAVDPVSGQVLTELPTGTAPTNPIVAFGYVWVPSIIDGTVTVLDEQTLGRTTHIQPVVSPDWLTDAAAIPGSLTGDEVWVTNVKGDIAAITAEGEGLGDVRPVDIDTSVNNVFALDDFVFIVPLFGLDVLVLDRQSGKLVTNVRTRAIPFRATVADDLLWVAEDGPREILTVIDPDTLRVSAEFDVGTNESSTTGPQRPVDVGDEIWVPNRGDDAMFIVGTTSFTPENHNDQGKSPGHLVSEGGLEPPRPLVGH